MDDRSKPVLKIEYLTESAGMSDEEFHKQEFKEFVVTEGMLHDLVYENVALENGHTLDTDNFFINKI